MAASKTETIFGNDSGVMGKFEWLKTINWMTLVWSLAAAVVAFVMTDVLPALQAVGGTVAAMVTAVVVPILIALKQWISDNSEKSVKVKK